MSRHPCIICEDVGTYEFEDRLYVCDCDAAQSSALNTTQHPSATDPDITSNDPFPVNSPTTVAAIDPSSNGPAITVDSHFIPTSPEGGLHYG